MNEGYCFTFYWNFARIYFAGWTAQENGELLMEKKEKPILKYIELSLIILIAILTVVRIFNNRTKNIALGISGIADGDVVMNDSRYLELRFDAPVEKMTGFSFWFAGNRDRFDGAEFLVTAEIENDLSNPQMLYEGVVPLSKQAFDGQYYMVIIPFEGDIQQGDHLRIAIMGVGMSEEDNITVKLSSRFGVADAKFEINDFEQENILAGRYYFQSKGVKVFPVLMQGIIASLLIVLAGEILKKPRRKREPIMTRCELPWKKRVLSLLPVFILLFIILDYTYYAGIKPQIQDVTPKKNSEFYPEDITYRELCDGEAVFLECNVEEDRFGGLGMYINQPYDDNGILSIDVSDLDTMDVITSAERAIYEVPVDEKGFMRIDFDSPVKKSAEKGYLISIYYSGGKPVELLLAGGGNDLRLIPLYQKNIFLNVLFIIFSVLAVGFTLVIALCVQNKMKLERLFFVAVVFLGILFEIVITPFSVPDEAAHIDTAYRLSNQILGVEDTGIKDAIYKRECDIYPDSGTKQLIDVENYRWLYEDWFSAERDKGGRLIYAGDVTPNANELYLLLPAVSITIGRILGIGFLPMVYLARTVNLLFMAWMIYQALKKLPFGKSLLCAITLLPITLQQIASCSYDALIIGVSFLYVSYCVFAIYSREKLEKKDILVILLTAVMLGMCKGGVYTPLYLLAVWAFIKRGYIDLPQKKGTKIVCIGAAGGLILAGIVVLVFIIGQPLNPYSLRNSPYPLAYLFQHPWETFRILENSIYRSINTYFNHLLGEGLGYFQVHLKFILPIGYIVLFAMALICSEKYPYTVDTSNKWVFLTAAGLSALAVNMAFLITNTAFGDKVIGGVQGRYFMPVLWLLLISMRSGRIVNRKKRYRKIVTIGYALGIAAVMQIIIETLGAWNV